MAERRLIKREVTFQGEEVTLIAELLNETLKRLKQQLNIFNPTESRLVENEYYTVKRVREKCFDNNNRSY